MTKRIDKITSDEWRQRATLWELLAISFCYPSEELAQAYASGEWSDAAEEIADALSLTLPSSWYDFNNRSENTGRRNAEKTLHALRKESTRLFFNPEGALVSPYESSWIARRNNIKELTFVSPSAMAVERFSQQCGLTRPAGTNEPLDFIGTELELLEYLAAMSADSTDPAGAQQAFFPNGNASTSYAKFLKAHPLAWITDFAEAVLAETKLSFFRTAATLLIAALRQ